MEKPYKYFAIDKVTKKRIYEGNILPSEMITHKYIPTEEDPNVSIYTEVADVYIDNRYYAKLRLYNYVTYTKKGLPIPKYQPYLNSPIVMPY